MRPNRIAPGFAATSLAPHDGVSPSPMGNGQQRSPKPYRQQLIEVKTTMHGDLKASGMSRDQVADLMSQRLHVEITRSHIDKWVGTNPNDLKYEIGLVKATAWADILGHGLINDSLEEIDHRSVAIIDAEIARLYRQREIAAAGLAEIGRRIA